MRPDPTATVDDRVLYIISQLVPVEPGQIRAEQRLREDLGMDSVGSMELLSMLAEEFQVDIELEEAMAVTTVAGAIEMARKHLDTRAG